MTEKNQYKAESIKVLEGLEGVRKQYDVVELSKKIKKKGDILILSQELKIKPRILNSAIYEGRILSVFPRINKSKAGVLARLRTDRELKIFSEKYDVYIIPARKLIQLVREWNTNIQRNPCLLISQEEHDLIIGSLLGDANIKQRQKNSCFRVAHSVKQENYISFKLDIINNFKISEFNKKNKVINNREVNMISLSTKTHPIFNFYRNLFYKNNRKHVTSEILNHLNARGLAFLICDDGSYETKQGYIILCTNAYTFEEHILMKEFFNKKFRLNPTIGFRDGKYYYLRFKKDDSRKLIEIIKPFIPVSMRYKIGRLKNE
ncbi:hypothetical protein J4221_06680 [Candidatus Pacearchaeota archaeon]|nr:hypothetical protein [Candidatus Pacearchaeota archaeon]